MRLFAHCLQTWVLWNGRPINRPVTSDYREAGVTRALRADASPSAVLQCRVLVNDALGCDAPAGHSKFVLFLLEVLMFVVFRERDRLFLKFACCVL